MTFVQTISFSTTQIEQIRAMAEEFQAKQGGEAPGYRRSWLLRDRDRENAYMISVEFDSYEQAMENSARPETDAFARRMAELVQGEMSYGNYDLIWGE